MKKVIKEIKTTEAALFGKPKNEKNTLTNLKRGIYLKNRLEAGTALRAEDFYYAMPTQDNQFNASHVDDLVGRVIKTSLDSDAPLYRNDVTSDFDSRAIRSLVKKTRDILDSAMVPLSGKEKIELSAHYGLENFANYGPSAVPSRLCTRRAVV